MKITSIDAFHVAIPLAAPYKLSKRYGTVREAHAVVTRVETDEGLVGYGEADPMPPFTADSWGTVFSAINHYLAPAILGEDPRDVSRLNDLFDGTLSGNLLAKGALDIALWDLLGKATGQPIHRLLGGALRREIPLLWPFGSGTPQEDVDRIAEKRAEGYGTFMIKMGALPIDVEIERAQAIERAYGAEIRVNVDANQGWNLNQALRFLDNTADCHLDFVEQPVPATQRWGFDVLRPRATHPISADESVQTLEQAADLAAGHAVDVFSLKISKLGGIERSRRVAEIASAFGLECLMNSMIELGICQAASLQLGSTVRTLLDCGHCYMSTLRLADDVTNFSSHIDSAVATVPEGPGLGIEVDEEKLQHYSQESLHVAG